MKLAAPKVRILSGKYTGKIYEVTFFNYRDKIVTVWIVKDKEAFTEHFPFSEVELVEEEKPRVCDKCGWPLANHGIDGVERNILVCPKPELTDAEIEEEMNKRD